LMLVSMCYQLSLKVLKPDLFFADLPPFPQNVRKR
jgi:hypothetical protein